ncbi:MAG: hypothetical protein ACI311_01925 [Bacilli bacterium]
MKVFVVTCSYFDKYSQKRRRYVFGADDVTLVTPCKKRSKEFKFFKDYEKAVRFASYYNRNGYVNGIKYCKVHLFNDFYNELKTEAAY